MYPIIAIIAFCLLARVLFFLVKVDGQSMYPTLNDGDWVLVLRCLTHRLLRQGQIVVWNLPSTMIWVYKKKFISAGPFIKRIVGLPGDEVVALVVKLPEQIDVVKQVDQEKMEELQRWHIPTGHCFVKGDSPGFDSTIAGPIPFHAIRGIVLVKMPRKTVSRQHQPISTTPPYVETSKKL
jgi:signal peptidase I